MYNLIKKLFLSVLLFICISTYSLVCFADDFISDEFLDNYTIEDIIETSASTTTEPITYSRNIIAVDRKTMTVLYEKNAYDVTPMASTTKIMTCIIALENSSLDEIVTVSKKASAVHGSTLGITTNMKISMRDLIYGLMLRSRKRLCNCYCRTHFWKYRKLCRTNEQQS